MRKSLVSLFLLVSVTLNAATPSEILTSAKPFQALSDRSLQIANAYLLALVAGVSASPSAILASASAFQALSDHDLEVAQTYLLSQAGSITATNAIGFITISARGIANGLSSVANDGARFGPDTPGTKTCGIQEAFNSVPRNVGYATNVAAIYIHFNPGDFFCTNVIEFSNTFVTSIKLEGAGLLGTRIIYAGTTNAPFDFFTIRGGGNPNAGSLNLPMHPTIRDICFMSITNTLMTLLRLTNCANEYVGNCNFTSWEWTTNVAQGAQVSLGIPCGAADGSGIIGLKIGNVNDNQSIVENCLFTGIAGGVDFLGDHAYCYKSQWSNIGETGLGNTGNKYPTTSVYSLGACVYRSVGIATTLDTLDFYSSALGIANDSTTGVGDFFVGNIELEGTDNGWYAAFSPGLTRVYITTASSGSEFVSGLQKITHTPYAISVASVGAYPIFPNLWATYNTATNSNANRLLGIATGQNFAGEVVIGSGLTLSSGTLTSSGGGYPGWQTNTAVANGFISTNDVAISNTLNTTGSEFFRSGRVDVGGNLTATNGTDFIGTLNFPADYPGVLIDVSITSAMAGGTRTNLVIANADGTSIIQADFSSDGNGAITNPVITVPFGIGSLRSNALASASITFPATTAKWTNTFSMNIVLYIDNSGVTGTATVKNNQQIFSSLVGDVTLLMKPGDYFSETYTIGTPTARWEPQ